MKIEVLKLFLSGTDRFEVGDVRTVADDRAAHFIARGWAKPYGGEAAVATAAGKAERAAATIQPASATHAQGVK